MEHSHVSMAFRHVKRFIWKRLELHSLNCDIDLETAQDSSFIQNSMA